LKDFRKILKYQKIRPMGDELFHADRRAERQTQRN